MLAGERFCTLLEGPAGLELATRTYIQREKHRGLAAETSMSRTVPFPPALSVPVGNPCFGLLREVFSSFRIRVILRMREEHTIASLRLARALQTHGPRRPRPHACARCQQVSAAGQLQGQVSRQGLRGGGRQRRHQILQRGIVRLTTHSVKNRLFNKAFARACACHEVTFSINR